MFYQTFTFRVILRIALIMGNVLLLSHIFGNDDLFFNQIILSLMLCGQVAELVYLVHHTNRELTRLFTAIRHEDFSISFRQHQLGASFPGFQDSLTDIIQAYKQVKIEKEAQLQLLRLVMNHIPIGIVLMAEEDISLINPAAEQLLQLSTTPHQRKLRELPARIAAEIRALGDGGRKLIPLPSPEGERLAALAVHPLVLLERHHMLITLQDINQEIEQKEIEAWHKLIRILTHEIMNSVTPIASLTETLQGMLTDASGQARARESLQEETIADIRFSLNTIHKRSEGLLRFVEDYRRLTRVPKPVLAPIKLVDFLQQLHTLLLPALQHDSIVMELDIADATLAVMGDAKMLEQVIINLVTNSVHALHHQPKKFVYLKSYAADHRVVIEVTDTGAGIPEKVMQEIFVPFFSTRKEGSGIGLSLSKQIISLHGGNIKVQSEPGRGTSFYLYLKRAALTE